MATVGAKVFRQGHYIRSMTSDKSFQCLTTVTRRQTRLNDILWDKRQL